MKMILIFISLLCLTFSFTLLKPQGQINLKNVLVTGGCSDSRIKTVNESIAQCQLYGIGLSTQCMKNYLSNHLNGEKWDVMAQIPQKSTARSSYWAYDQCSIRYQKYGKLGVTYTVWKASASNSVSTNQYLNFHEVLSTNAQPNDDCSQNRKSAAKTAINYCQIADLAMEVSCVRNNIKTKNGQKWNVVVAQSQKSQYSIKYEYFDGCAIKMDSFGPRKRNYLVWKAE